MQQASAEGYLPYRGRSPDVVYIREKSAEVIVVGETSCDRNAEASQTSEGLNIKLFQMLHGMA